MFVGYKELADIVLTVLFTTVEIHGPPDPPIPKEIPRGI